MTNLKISEPKEGQVVWHTGWGKEGDPNYPCNVQITGGKYFSNGRLSNFWYWKRISPRGKVLSKEECGYGSFTESPDFETKTVVVKKKVS